MSLRPKRRIQWVVLLTLVSLLFFYVGWYFRELVYDFEWTRIFKENELLAKESAIQYRVQNSSRKLSHQEISPDKKRRIRMYEMPFSSGFQQHYYDYLSSQFTIAVAEEDSNREQYIFVADYKSGNPHWLDNDYVYFTAGCGTACRGLYLVNTNNKESRIAVISYMFSYKKGGWETYFKDWFDQEFTFEGLVNEIKSEVRNGKTYLKFDMIDDKKNSLGQKWFLFTGDYLKAL